MDWLTEIDHREQSLRDNLGTILSILKKSYSDSSDELDDIAHSVAEIQMMIERYAAEHDSASIELLQMRYPVFNQLRRSLPVLCA